MKIDIQELSEPCGARVGGLDLRVPLDAESVSTIRAAWLRHHVLVFPEQELDDDRLERFTLAFGGFGDDPFIAPVAGREHVIAVRRRADETAPVFAENWHTDWSFQQRPPAGTCLYGLVIPPVGGDTLFANQHAALERMPEPLRQRIDGLVAVHSARASYAPNGLYGEADAAGGRSMDIKPSKRALESQQHPLVRRHPETDNLGLFGCLGYITGIAGTVDEAALELLVELLAWQTREEFTYRHTWKPGMLVMWDNRSVLHRATGGYDGHDRLLHRTTIAAA